MIELGTATFETWTAAKRELKSIIHRTADNVRIVGPDADLLVAALELHPEVAHKVGTGVRYFTARPHPTYPRTRCIFVEREDNSSVPVSFDNLGKSHSVVTRYDRLRALRFAIIPQVLAYRERVLSTGVPVYCPVTNERVLAESGEVDHWPPLTFHRLVEMWLESQGTTLEALEIIPPPHPHCELADPAVVASWTTFHETNARLRLLSRNGHRTVTRTALSRRTQ